ncbi:hypothetical protein ABB02_01235 [Clostridiaceae bacterium JG1575]|nr:hypothetical protein ABB02_01235 [Clostridiaceae bacterium JG1575]
MTDPHNTIGKKEQPQKDCSFFPEGTENLSQREDAGPRIIVVGGGYAGWRAAKRLAQKVQGPVRITLMDESEQLFMKTQLVEVASGSLPLGAIALTRRELSEPQEIFFLQDRLERVDLEKQLLHGRQQSYAYDYLILALGSGPVVPPGLNLRSVAFFPMEPKSAQEAGLRLRAMKEGQITICGGGAVGVELALEVAARYPKLRVRLVTRGDGILLEYSERVRRSAMKEFKKRNVALYVGHTVTQLVAGGLSATGPDGACCFSSDLTFWAVGGAPEHSVEGLWRAADGRFLVDDTLRMGPNGTVFCIGDCAFGSEGSVPSAHHMADVCADNVLLMMEGKPLKTHHPQKSIKLLSLGPHQGAVQGPILLFGWPARALKSLVEWLHLLLVGGWVAALRSFLAQWGTPGRRNLFGPLFSTRGPLLWLLPLRFAVGFLWAKEGLSKIVGPSVWAAAQSPLDLLTLGPDSWLRPGTLHMPFSWLQGADLQTSATLGSANGPVLTSLPGWYEALMRTLMPTPGVAQFFQSLLGLTEGTVGVLLLLGLFTWMASLVSAAMTVNFILAGVAGTGVLWLIPASLALMAGSGNLLGLDGLRHRRFLKKVLEPLQEPPILPQSAPRPRASQQDPPAATP